MVVSSVPAVIYRTPSMSSPPRRRHRARLGILAYLPFETGLSCRGLHGQATRSGDVCLAVGFRAAANSGRFRREIAMAADRSDPSGSALIARLKHLRRVLGAALDHPIARRFAKSR